MLVQKYGSSKNYSNNACKLFEFEAFILGYCITFKRCNCFSYTGWSKIIS